MLKKVFSPEEIRVIGCFLEKQVTTPDQYPLSLYSLTAACNQKTNREPVMTLTESDVQGIVDVLIKKHQIRALNMPGNRVIKYEHRFCNSEFGQLTFSEAEIAILCCLLLRGSQTIGELRQRTYRMYQFADVNETEKVLQQLATREDGPFVVSLKRESGKREERYAHLLSGDAKEQCSEPVIPLIVEQGLAERISELEREVTTLKQRLEQLYPERHL